MATGTNGIATYADCNSLSGTSYNAPNTAMCPTKLDITSAYMELTISGSYTDPQCVRYSDLNLPAPGDLVFSQTTFSPLDYSYTLTIQTASNTTRVHFRTDDWIGSSVKVTMNNQTLSSDGYIDVASNSTYTCTITCDEKDSFGMEVTPYNVTKKGNSVTLVFREE